MLLDYETEITELADQSQRVLRETAIRLRTIATHLPEEAQLHIDMCELAEGYEVVASEITVVDLKVADRDSLNGELEALLQRIVVTTDGLRELLRIV